MVGHDVNEEMLRGRVDLCSRGARETKHIARKLDDHELHAIAKPEIRNLFLAGVADDIELALDARFAKATGNENPVKCIE